MSRMTRRKASGVNMHKGLYLLSQLTDLDVDWLLTAGAARHEAPGTLLFRKGEHGDAVLIILAGTACVFDPATHAAIATLGEGELLGEISL